MEISVLGLMLPCPNIKIYIWNLLYSCFKECPDKEKKIFKSHSYALREEINVGLGHVNPAIVASKMVMAKETLCKDYLSSPVMHKITKTIHTVPVFPFWQNL